MPGGDQLERIATLVDRVQLLGAKRRGMRIESDEWNALVEALLGLLEIDRAQERVDASGAGVARSEHEHSGSVQLHWLDPALQERIGGPTFSLRNDIASLQSRVDAVGRDIAGLRSMVDDSRRDFDRRLSTDLERSSRLAAFEGRFSTVEALRGTVESLSTRMRGLDDGIRDILVLREHLTSPGGEPIDVSSLREEVSRLGELRDRLSGVDGTPLRLRDLEIRLSDLEATGGLGTGSLDERIVAAVTELRGRLETQLDERVASIRAGIDQEASGFRRAMETRLDEGVRAVTAQLEASAESKITAAETRITERENERLSAFHAELTASIRADTTAAIEAQISSLPGKIEAATTSVRTAMEGSIRAKLIESLDAVLATTRTDLEADLAARMTPLLEAVGTMDERIQAAVDTDMAAIRPEIEAFLTHRVDHRLSETGAALEARLADSIGSAVAGALEELDTRISSVVDFRIENIQLDQRVATAVSERLSTLSDEISIAVDEGIGRLDLAGSLSRLQIKLSSEFKQQLALTAQSLEDARVRAMSDTVSTLTADIRKIQADVAQTREAQAKDMQTMNARMHRVESREPQPPERHQPQPTLRDTRSRPQPPG